MSEFEESYRPDEFDVAVAELRLEAARRLGKPAPSWVREVLAAAERNGIAPIEVRSA